MRTRNAIVSNETQEAIQSRLIPAGVVVCSRPFIVPMSITEILVTVIEGGDEMPAQRWVRCTIRK
jgi:hypothetical protein